MRVVFQLCRTANGLSVQQWVADGVSSGLKLPEARVFAQFVNDGNISQFKSVEECEKVLENIGFSQCEVVELHDKIKIIIDGVLDTILDENDNTKQT